MKEETQRKACYRASEEFEDFEWVIGGLRNQHESVEI